MVSKTTIEPGLAPITLVNVFTVKPKHQDKLVAALIEATETTIRSLDGFVSANIHKSLDGKRVVNYAQWRSKEDFDAMMRTPKALLHMAPILLYAKPSPHLYEVVDVQHI
ncbi:MAG: antibiotic biosynthesis monooxygenase [Sphingomonas sp.]|uniref:antibiotic biosynthesis monooxygenase family protein n=1 Tax=Sphingomonas sp. TaxID=28214 RepID=UPI002634E062|nr:antibiotic biosynthesis monooxygenase family protein [Sphingomonas sp.]MDK2768106.1 antibiotic biosynthesis monooxygenase [Sphingomonas sp.]